MKVSLNWLSRYVDLKDIKAQDLANTLTLAGLEVESVESIAHGTNLVIGEVLECEKHPESDHLSKTLVNVGDEVVSIVCGAPNVRKGQKVIVAKVGAVLPQITIKKASLKGVESNGMICSLLELGVDAKTLTDDQKSGIEVLDDSVVVGSEALSTLGLDDVIIDVKQTPNRNDCNALWSVAYEVSALLNRKINLPWKKDAHLVGTSSNLVIGSETLMCPLFLGKHIGSVKVGPSIDWMKRELEAVGMKSINNVVDISNYVMIETGQPLHFYDSSKLSKFEIIVKDHQVGTLKTLDDSDLIIDENDIVITSNGKPIGLAGIMGGDDSKIDESTHSIIIEAAQFNPTRIRHTSRRVNLLTEASLRFQKGIDPNAAFKAMDRAVQLLVEYADAKLIEETKIHGSINTELKVVKVSHTHIEELLGSKVSLDKCIDLFKRLRFNPTIDGEWISCTVPSYRLDIEVAEDLIEEVGRIIGYADLKGSLPVMPSTQGGYNPRQLARQKIRQLATGFGMNEVITYTLVHEDKCADGVYPLDNPARLMSPLSEERRYVRNNLLTSLLDTANYNQSHKMKDFQIFEISNLNTMKINQERLAFVLSGNHEVSIWQKQNTAYDFYSAKGIVERILFELGFASNRIKFETNEGSEFFHPLRSSIITVDKKIVGVIGEIHPKTAKKYDVSTVVMGEIILETLFELKTSKIKYTSINKMPAVIRDIALVCDESVLASDIEKVIKAVSKDIIQSVTIFDVYQGDKVEKGKKSIALKVVYQANDHTLSEDEITSLYQKTIEACKKGLNADLRIA